MSIPEPTSIFAWNEYLKVFITELCETFTECAELYALMSAIEAKIAKDEQSVMEQFLDDVGPYSEAIAACDEELFLSADIPFLKKLGIEQYWTPDLGRS